MYFKELIANGKPVFKIIMLDFSMPGMNGPQTAIEIIRICREADIPKPIIYCVTAYQE